MNSISSFLPLSFFLSSWAALYLVLFLNFASIVLMKYCREKNNTFLNFIYDCSFLVTFHFSIDQVRIFHCLDSLFKKANKYYEY